MDFAMENLNKERIAYIEEKINEAVEADYPIRVYSLPREKAFAIPDLIRTKINLLPPQIEEVRIVEIVGLADAHGLVVVRHVVLRIVAMEAPAPVAVAEAIGRVEVVAAEAAVPAAVAAVSATHVAATVVAAAVVPATVMAAAHVAAATVAAAVLTKLGRLGRGRMTGHAGHDTRPDGQRRHRAEGHHRPLDREEPH